MSTSHDAYVRIERLYPSPQTVLDLPSASLATILPVMYLAACCFLLATIQVVVALLRPKAVPREQFLECREAPRVAQRAWLWGLDLLLEIYGHVKRHTYSEHILRMHVKYGKTIQTAALGSTKISTIEPVNIQTILKERFHDYLARPARQRPLDGLVGHGILTADGDVWKRHRTLMKPSFSKVQLEDFSIYEEHVQHLFSHIPGDGTPTDLQHLFLCLTMDVSTDHLFGASCLSLVPSGELSPGLDLQESFDRAQRAAVVKFALGPFDKLRPQLQYWADTKRVREYADSYIHKILGQRDKFGEPYKSPSEESTESSFSQPQRRTNVLDSFAKQTDSPVEIRAGVLHLLVGGRDTTAALLTNMFQSLAQHPRIWQKLRAEISALDGSRPNAARVKQMPYLKQCIHESLRCYPPIPWSPRMAARDTILPTGGGDDQQSPILVRKGTLVLIPLYSLHRHPDFWGADADEFVPERWDSVTPSHAYLPFMAGIRKCLGWEFALNTAAYVIIRLVQQYPEIEAADDRPWTEELGLSMTSTNGARVILRKGPCAGRP